MFFWEEEVDESIIKNEGSLESRGNFTPHNLDVNWTFFNVFNERSYSRWRFHYILVFVLLTLISTYYPIIFMIAFWDLMIFIGSGTSDVEWMTEDYFHDYTLYVSQIKGGDDRLNIYVFVYYDRLGYVIYGLSDIGEDYCEDLFEYNDFLGLSNNIQNKCLNIIENKKIDKKETDKILLNLNDINLMNIYNKYFYVYRNNDVIDLSKYNYLIINLLRNRCYLNKHHNLKYNYILNYDRSITWVEYNNFLKEFINKYKL